MLPKQVFLLALSFQLVYLSHGFLYGNEKHNALTIRAQELNEGPSIKDSSLKVVDGQDADEGEIPWQVLLIGVKPESDPLDQYMCGGSIIDKQWILTAAHCVMEGFDITVIAGELILNETSGSEVTAEVDKAFSHSNFNNTGKGEDDIALLKLKEPLNYTSEVSYINLPYQYEGSTGRECIVSGWGATNNSEEYPNMPLILQIAKIPVVSDEKCEESCKNGGLVPNKDDCDMPKEMLCAGYEEGGSQACNGDSGGALVCSRSIDGYRYVAGIVSQSLDCGIPHYYTYYTEVSFYLDWIADTMKEEEGGSGAGSVTLTSCLLIFALFLNKIF